MKEINLKKDLTNINFSIIAEKYQHVTQYNNIGAQLLHKGRAVVYVEDTGIGKIEYLLDKEERKAALKNPDKFLDKRVQEWISNDNDVTLSLCRWFPEKIGSSFDEDGPCRVLIVGCFFGYEPIQWAKNDADDDIVFSSPDLAQDWIEAQENEPYILKHGEADRPEYFIISA